MKLYKKLADDFCDNIQYHAKTVSAVDIPIARASFECGFHMAKRLYMEFLDNNFGHYTPCGPKDSCDSYCHEVKEASKIGEEEV